MPGGEATLFLESPLPLSSLSIIQYLVEHQKFLIYVWKNFEFGEYDKDKLLWISSERFNNLYVEKEKRTYDKCEINDIVPKYVICLMTTDQPLGGVRYV